MAIIAVDPAGGGDYTTLQGAEDVADSTFTDIECYEGDMGACTWDDTDPATVDIRPASGETVHDGTFTPGTCIEMNGTFGLSRTNISMSYVFISNGGRYNSQNRGNNTLKYCLIVGPTGNVYPCIQISSTSGTSPNNLIVGNIVYVRNTQSTDGRGGISAGRTTGGTSTGTGSGEILRNTIYRYAGSTGNGGMYFVRGGSNSTVSYTLTGNAVFGWSGDIIRNSSLASLTSNSNATSDSTADNYGGTGHFVNQTFADWFTSTTDLHLKTGSNGINSGIDVGVEFTEDWEGDVIGRPSIGADEWPYEQADIMEILRSVYRHRRHPYTRM